MNRVWDYIGFAVWFAGSAISRCGCVGSPDHLMLPPALHAFGVAAAMLVPVRLLIARRRQAPRRGRCPPAPAAQARRSSAAAAAQAGTCRSRQVKPRSHFGLRGCRSEPVVA